MGRTLRLRRERKKVSLGKRAARSSLLAVGIVALFYLWQPQKLDLFPKDPPPSPRVRPEEVGLFETGKRVAVVVAHPDDSEFYISGTLLRLKASGAKLLIVLTTAGDKGYYPPFTTDVEGNRRIRREEQIEAAKAYGAEVTFLNGPDGRYLPDDAAKRQMAQALRDFRPEVILAFDGDYPPRIQHRDHRNSGIVAEAVAREAGASWLLRFSTHAPNLWIDTSDLWDRRSDLLAIHKSQFYGERLERIRGMVYGRAEEDGRRGGFDLAEAFRATKL